MATDPVQEQLRSRREPGGGVSAQAFCPRLFRLDDADERRLLGELLPREPDAIWHDTIPGQLEELIECRDPRVKNDPIERRKRVAAHLDGRSVEEYGCLVYFPWSRRLVRLLPEAEFREVRASRNRYKITVEEQNRLRSFTIGVVGLSVGQAIAMTMALEGCAGAYRLADYDTLALSNLNRLACSVADLGLNKAVLSARRLFEVDPYLDVQIFPMGLDETSVDGFVSGGGGVSLLVEECDDLFMKVYLRERARFHRVPVLMETNDRGMLDVERFDLEPQRELFHGLLGPVQAQALRGLPTKEKVPFVLKILGEMSPRLAASLVEIDQTISSWPQLGSGAMLGGAVAADAARRLLLGDFTASGRFCVDVHALVADAPLGVVAESPHVQSAAAAAAPAATLAAPVSPPRQLGGGLSHEQVRQLVSCAVLAPSGGNCQPWKFVWKGDGVLSCFHDVPRSASFLDFEHRAAHLALGAAVENLAIAAAEMHLAARVITFPAADPSHVCDVRFEPAAQAAHDDRRRLFPFLTLRASNRRLGPRQPLSAADLAQLRAVVDDPAVELQALSEATELDEIGAVLGAGDRFRFFSETLYREMMAEMRWNPRQAEESRDGIDIATLELREVDEAGLRLLSSWPAVRFLRSIGMGRALEDLSRRAVESASAVLLLCRRGTSCADYFAGGRAMERVWLAATALGLAVQPLSALPYLFARLERGTGFDAQEQDELRRLRARYARLFHVEAQTGELLLFRLAQVPAATARSLRRSADAVLSFV